MPSYSPIIGVSPEIISGLSVPIKSRLELKSSCSVLSAVLSTETRSEEGTGSSVSRGSGVTSIYSSGLVISTAFSSETVASEEIVSSGADAEGDAASSAEEIAVGSGDDGSTVTEISGDETYGFAVS